MTLYRKVTLTMAQWLALTGGTADDDTKALVAPPDDGSGIIIIVHP